MPDLKTLTIQELSQAIEKSRKIVIIPHKNPDGDAIGSSLGLCHYLHDKQKDCHVVVNDSAPYFIDFLPKFDQIKVFESDQSTCIDLVKNADLIICTDYSQLHRCGDLQPYVEASPAPKAVIDHHPGPDPNFDFYFHTIAASSTSELVYLYIHDADPGYLFNKDIASCLYTGLLTDTGSFRHALRSETFMVAAELLKTGISYEFLVSKIFDSNTPQRLKLVGYALNEKLMILNDYRTAYISISFEESEKLGLKKGDTEGLVNYCLSINDIVMGVFFHEREKGKTKISLRSKGNFAVNSISQQYFGGGGHKNAAGGEFTGSAQETINKFLEILPQYKDQLSSLEIGQRD